MKRVFFALFVALTLLGCSKTGLVNRPELEPYKVREPSSDEVAQAREGAARKDQAQKEQERGQVQDVLYLIVEAGKDGSLNLAKNQIVALQNVLEKHPGAEFIVEGHTGGMEDAEQERAISLQRAREAGQSLARILRVEPERIRAVGLGKEKPLYADSTEIGRRKNYRFHIRVLPGEEKPASAPRPQAPPARIDNRAALSVDLRFSTGQADPGQAFLHDLKVMAARLKDDPEATLRIEGHTDNVGSEAKNQALSEQRAQSVRDILVRDHGIAPERLDVAGYGEADPIADNNTRDGRWLNRRVTLTLVSDADKETPLLSSDQEFAEYEIEVSVSQCRLWLYGLREDGVRQLVDTYVVATPRNGLAYPLGWGEITKIDFNPSWTPTANMKSRAARQGKRLPSYVAPHSPANPMGEFKMHLSHGPGYRIHGTNRPSQLGLRVSSGCIRMHNQEGLELAHRVSVGTRVNVYF